MRRAHWVKSELVQKMHEFKLAGLDLLNGFGSGQQQAEKGDYQ